MANDQVTLESTLQESDLEELVTGITGISREAGHVSPPLLSVQAGDKPDLKRLYQVVTLKEVLGRIEKHLNTIKEMEQHAAEKLATKLGVDQVSDENITVSVKDDVRFGVTDWSQIPTTVMQKRLTETNLKDIIKDPNNPDFAKINELCACGIITSTPFKNVSVRRKPGR